MLYITALIVLAAHTAVSNKVKNKPFDKYLVSAEVKLSSSATELKKTYQSLAHFVKNGYKGYTITYNTHDIEGNTVIASGAVFIPDVKEPLPILNYNHGTYFPSGESKAPSYLSNWNPELGIGKLFAASGYIVVLPDYIGYGATKKLKHPYGAYNHIAATSIDMLRAVKELCEKENVTLSGKNFFSGWSEGAAVSLAVVKTLQENSAGEFKPTATVANAGPYYSSAFVDHILESTEPLTYMSTYAWVLQSYNWIYNIDKPYAYYFNEPAAGRLEKNMEASIPHNPLELFTSSFRNSYKAGKEKALEEALKQNDLWDWKPESKMILCHGDEDDYVPLFNSEKAYKEMKAKGADISLKIFKGHSHSSSAFNYMQLAYSTFESLK